MTLQRRFVRTVARVRRADGRHAAARAARRPDVDQPAARVRLLDPVRRQRRRADLLRRAAAAHAARARCVGAPLRRGGRRLPGAAAQPAGDAVHARRLDRRRARRDARDHVQLVDRARASRPCRSPAFAGSLIAVAHRLRARRRPRHRGLSTTVLLLAGVTMNAFFSALILFVQYFAELRRHLPHAALADGRPRRRAATSRSSRRCRSIVAAFAVFAWLARPLNLLALGADSAESRGLDVAQRAARWRSSARRSRPAPPCRSAARSASSASSFRTWCG